MHKRCGDVRKAADAMGPLPAQNDWEFRDTRREQARVLRPSGDESGIGLGRAQAGFGPHCPAPVMRITWIGVVRQLPACSHVMCAI
jgi:hypothetical protein